MKLKRLIMMGSATILSLSSLLAFSAPLVHASGTTDTWVGGTDSDWGTAANWSNGVPVSGDDLVFPTTSLTAPATLDNNITGLSLGNISISGTNSNNVGYIITGDDISLSGGITDTSDASLINPNEFNLNITLTANQTFSSSTSAIAFGPTSSTYTLNLDSFNLGLSSTGANNDSIITVYDAVAGTGTLSTDAGQASGIYNFEQASPYLSGPVSILAGTVYDYSNASSLGSGPITIDPNASLQSFYISKDVTLANDITMGGSNVLGLQDDCPSGGGACANDGTISFSGTTTLSAAATISAYAPLDFTGTVNCSSYNISETSNSTSTISGLPTSCYDPTTSNAAAAGAAVTTPKTPDTGLAAISASPILELGITTAAAAALVIAAKYRKVHSQKR